MILVSQLRVGDLLVIERDGGIAVVAVITEMDEGHVTGTTHALRRTGRDKTFSWTISSNRHVEPELIEWELLARVELSCERDS